MKIRRKLMHSSALAGALSLSLFAGAMAADTYRFDIPAQPLGDALREFARASGEPIVFREEIATGRRAPALRGDYTAEGALGVLLAEAGLRVERSVTGVYMVQDPQGGSADGGAANNAVDALIVTAQKREENIQDVPIAISAFTQEDLTTSQIAGGPDLITQVPNMTFTKTNFSSYSIQLRGIGTQAISATTDPAVAVAFNNTPFIRNRFFEQEFYDLDRVEVLRGPQGTLYGRNATAGVVNIISAKPKFRYEAKASGDVGNFNSSRIEGMVNIPLLEDKAALRLAGAWTKRDGYATNQLTGEEIDGRDLWSTRLSLRVTPNDAIDVSLIWEHFEEEDARLRSGKQLCKKNVIDQVGGVVLPNPLFQVVGRGQGAYVQEIMSQGCERESLYSEDSFQTPNGMMLPYYLPLSRIGLPAARLDPYVSTTQSTDLRMIESTIDPKYRAKSDLAELQVSFDVGDNLTITSETAYSNDFVYSMQDFNRFNTAAGAWRDASTYNNRDNVLRDGPNGAIFCDPQLGCSDRLLAVDVSTAEARQFSQEVRLASNFDGPFNFSLGANYLRADSEDKYYVFINSLGLISAGGASFAGLDPYVPGVSDNIDCMFNGYDIGNPNSVYPVVQCVYLDPNPIDRVNDQGHNYFLSKNPYKLISYALFGEIYYELADNLKLTGGLRLTVDKKDAPRIPSWVLAGNSVGYPVAEVIEQEWTEPTGRLTLDWKPDFGFTEETMLYASYAHGYKAGGANPPGFVRVYYVDPISAINATSTSATRPKTFEAEFVDAFEVGAKNVLAGGDVTLNMAAFYYDYKDYQISEIVDRSAFNRNFDATVWGVELEADWRALDNLKFGFKGGYEKTRIADGERAIDLMDRTAGRTDWVIARPFPTYASSCILPAYVFANDGVIVDPGGSSGGNLSACEIAYQQGFDPVTMLEYVADPQVGADGFLGLYTDYPGFNPLDESQGHNGGEGFSKDLGGNELPNAPNWTATITADYTLPLPGDWLATLHTDLHWQSESYWRIFNDHEYNKLDEYFTTNVAAIFTNEEQGWHVMAYVKNVTDETAITGAFLNSDDTGLTTNVFLTEPRLYGLRVTKAFTGGPLLGSFGERREGPSPFTLELGGQVQRHDAPNGVLEPGFTSAFPAPFDIVGREQEQDLDWGDGGEVKLSWDPGEIWSVSVGARFGKTNGHAQGRVVQPTDPVCAVPDPGYCDVMAQNPALAFLAAFSQNNHAEATVHDLEEHMIVDFAVMRDVGIGGLARSKVGLGLRYARLKSATEAGLRGTPDWEIEEGFYYYLTPHTVYDGTANARREFEGAGPSLSWEASYRLMADEAWGNVDLDWTLSGGALFGTRQTAVTAVGTADYYEFTGFQIANMGSASVLPKPLSTTTAPPVDLRRSNDGWVPTLSASLGLSYSVGGFKVGAGYRWERYFDAIDGGFDTEKTYDRTIDGPYFKIAVGFGG